MKRRIPWMMVWVRALLGPLMVLAAWKGTAGSILAAVVFFGLVDDITDGMLARRWGCATAALRLADSSADAVFYVGTAIAMWMRTPQLLRHDWKLLFLLLGLEALRYVFDFSKFGKASSYHSYFSKFWGLVLASAIVCALAIRGPQWLVTTAIALGIVANLEGLAMSLILPRWRNDVKTLATALRIREDSAQGGVGGC